MMSDDPYQQPSWQPNGIGPPGQPGQAPPTQGPGPGWGQQPGWDQPPAWGPQPAWGQPAAWGQQPGYGYGPPQQTNGLAVASLVLGILWIYWIGSVLAIVFGAIAKRQIRDSAGLQTGSGLATAGIVLGGIGVASFLLIFAFGAFVLTAGSMPR